MSEISKIKMPNDEIYYFKDEEARIRLEKLLGPQNWDTDDYTELIDCDNE